MLLIQNVLKIIKETARRIVLLPANKLLLGVLLASIIISIAGQASAAYNCGYTWKEQTGAGQRYWWRIAGAHLPIRETNPIPHELDYLVAVDIGDNATGGYLYLSNDNGTTWVERAELGKRVWYTAAMSADGSRVTAAEQAPNGFIYESRDYGITWNNVNNLASNNWMAIAQAGDRQSKLAVDYSTHGFIYYLYDNGTVTYYTTFDSDKDTTVHRGGLWLSAALDYFGGAGYLGTAGGYVYKWNCTLSGCTLAPLLDAGRKYWWSIAVETTVPHINDDGTYTAFPNVAAIEGYGGYIYTSKNSGSGWTKQEGPGYKNWTSIAMGTYKDSFILAATTFTTDGYIYTSNDNGTTWTKQTDAGKRNWTSITMSSDGTRLAATDFGGYIYTAQPPEYFLRIVKTGTGSGSVISTGGPINWDDKIGTTMHVCPQSTVLSALPTIGASFSGWTGCDSSSGAECTVTMTSPKEVTAVFGNPMTDQTLVVSGQGNGTITSSPSGINCGTQGSSCYRTYALNTMVTLTATPDSTDYAFKSWDGCDSTNGSQCTVIMSTSKNVGAVFVQVSTYNVSVSKTGGGTVTSSPMGLYCGTACSTKFGDNSTVVLTATADPGYGFSSWTGCDSSVDEQCTIKVNSDNRSLSVFFDTTANLQYNDAVAAMNSVYAQMSTFFGGPSGSVQTLSSSSGTVYVQWYATGTALAAWFDGYVWYYYNKVWYDTGVKWTRDSLTNLQKATSIINTLYNQNSAYYGTKSGDVTAYSGTSGKYYVQWYTSSGLLAWSDGYMYYYANGTWVYTGVAWK